MNDKVLQNINGKFLYYAFLAGSRQILRKQSELNDINVFPVVDKDTGTNLASTMRSVIDNISPHKSYKTTVGNIADAAMIGARGNSGVIFAQFLHGLSQETKEQNTITLKDFSESLKNSIPYIYEAVANPVEGTILTVIREWADFISARSEAIHNFKNVIIESLEVLHKALKETTSKLGELGKYGFVDAGAKGFVIFIEGIIDFVKHRNIRTLLSENVEKISLVHTEDMLDEEIRYRYCTEALLKDLKTEKNTVRDILERYGDSVVVAGSEKNCRIHVHTDDSAALFHELRNYATITFQKVDDMVRQHSVATSRKWKIALLTDSTCDLSDDLMNHYQVNMVPINLNFGQNQYLDKVTVQPEQFYELLQESEVFPSTSQVNEYTFINMYSHLASHYDAIIALHLTGQFSGTYANSVKAARRIEKEFGKPVHVFDSRNLSGALGLMVLKTAMEIEAGSSFETIIARLEEWRDNARIFVSVKNLKYMIRGGRVSGPKGMIAKALGLNPVISMNKEGKSILFGKTFSQKASLEKIFRHIEKLISGDKVWNYIILHAQNPEGALLAKQRLEHIIGKGPVSVVNISPVIGMHAGQGAIAIAVLNEKETAHA